MNIFKFRKDKKRKKVWGIVAGILAALLTGIAVLFPFRSEGSFESEPIPEDPIEEETFESPSPAPMPRREVFGVVKLELIRDIVDELGDEPIERHSEIERHTLDLIEAEAKDKGQATKKPE